MVLRESIKLIKSASSSITNPLAEAVFYGYEVWRSLTPKFMADLVLHFPQYYNKWWTGLLKEAPLHILIETLLICFIVWLLVWHRTEDPNKLKKKSDLTEKEKNRLIEEWVPEPLTPPLKPRQQALTNSKVTIEEIRPDGYLIVRGVSKPVLNLSSFDFLGLSRNPSVKQISREALDKYGCGSCGPRGFYGTIDKHLDVEKEISSFMGTQEAISYSDSASAIASAIPAFAKKGDLLIVDEACNEPIQTGLNLSRATVQTFKHNDMADLRQILQSISEDDQRLRRDTTQQRRFIVTEGLFRATGNICPLREILELKEKYCYRLIMDESLSFGSLGATGRGVTELFGVKVTDVEMILLAMDTSLASVGGVCVGSREIVDHQRLSGAGYCFSAAGPPFLSASASEALRLMIATPKLLQDLKTASGALTKALASLTGLLEIRGKSEDAPVVHLVLAPRLLTVVPEGQRGDAEYFLIMDIANRCLRLGTGVSSCKFGLTKFKDGSSCIRPSIRVCASATLTAEQIAVSVANIRNAVETAVEALTKQVKGAPKSPSADGNAFLGFLGLA